MCSIGGLSPENQVGLRHRNLAFLVTGPLSGRGFSLVLSKDLLTLAQKTLQGPMHNSKRLPQELPVSKVVFCNPLFMVHPALLSHCCACEMHVHERGCLYAAAPRRRSEGSFRSSSLLPLWVTGIKLRSSGLGGPAKCI